MQNLTDMRRSQFWQTYTACADDGKGGDVTNNGAPLKTFKEWMAS